MGKRTKKKAKSIITDELDYCYLCGSPYVEIHHCMYGSYRQLSDKYGLVIPLCYEHHRGNNGVHFNKALDKQIKELAQEKFKSHYGKDIIDVFGKNFI